MANTCSHAKYATRISALKRAAELGLKGIALSKAVERCERCKKWKVFA